MLAGAVPAHAPELPADLKSNHRLAGACSHREENSFIPFKDSLNRSVDRDFLIVAMAFADRCIRRCQCLASDLVVVESRSRTEASPEFLRSRKGAYLLLFANNEIELDNAVAVGRVGKVESQHLSVLFGLLEPIARQFIGGLGFHDGNREVTSVTQQIIGAFWVSPARLFSHRHDSSVREALLLADLVVIPARCIKLWQDIFSAGVSFGDHRLESTRKPAANRGRVVILGDLEGRGQGGKCCQGKY